jgi:hypothetical protein
LPSVVRKTVALLWDMFKCLPLPLEMKEASVRVSDISEGDLLWSDGSGCLWHNAEQDQNWGHSSFTADLTQKLWHHCTSCAYD